MLVCLCKGVSCSVVRREIAAGARTVAAIGERCGAGTDCGGCHGELEAMLEQASAARALTSAPPPSAPVSTRRRALTVHGGV